MPPNMGRLWTKVEMWAAVKRGLHELALEDDAIMQLEGEIAAKVKENQCKVILWDEIKHYPTKAS